MRSPFIDGLVNADWGPAPGTAALAMQGNQQLANGISTAGAALAGAIDKHREEQKRIADQGKVADGLVAQYPDLLKPLNLTPEQFKNMGAKDKAPLLDGAVKGIQLLQQATHLRQQQTLLDQRIREQQQQAEDYGLLDRTAKNFNVSMPKADLTGDSILNYMTGTASTTPATGAQFPQLLENFSAAHPSAAMRNAHNLSYLDKALAQGGKAITPSFIQDPVTGARFLGRGNTTLPSGTDPSVMSSNLPTISGFTAAPTGKGGYTWLKTPDNTLTTDENIKLLGLQQKMLEKDFSEGAQAKRAAIEDAIKRLQAGGNPAPAGGGGATGRFKIVEVK